MSGPECQTTFWVDVKFRECEHFLTLFSGILEWETRGVTAYKCGVCVQCVKDV